MNINKEKLFQALLIIIIHNILILLLSKSYFQLHLDNNNFVIFLLYSILLFISILSHKILYFRPGYLSISIFTRVISTYFSPFVIVFFIPDNFIIEVHITFTALLVLITSHIIFLKYSKPNPRYKKKVAIYGAGIAGRNLSEDLLSGSQYDPVCFIDDDIKLEQNFFYGRKIFSFHNFLKSKYSAKVEMVFVAMPSINSQLKKNIISALQDENFIVRTLPEWENIGQTNPTVFHLKDASPADFFERPEVDLEYLNNNDYFKGKTVVVSGGGGSIGSELCIRLLSTSIEKLVIIEHSELAVFELEKTILKIKEKNPYSINIKYFLGSCGDKELLGEIFNDSSVDIFFHAAAYKHVPLLEKNFKAAFKNNFLSTKSVNDFCSLNNVENFVLVSTDKAVRPTNIMGVSKRLCELYCLANGNSKGMNTTVVRFGNVLGSSGSVLNEFNTQIQQGGPVLVTHPNIERYFMSRVEAATLLLRCASLNKGSNLFVLDMGEAIRIVDLARKSIERSGYIPYIESMGEKGDIEIIFTGLRPGEKLYEELLVSGKFIKTSHEKIVKMMEKMPLSGEVKALEDNIFSAIKNDNLNELNIALKSDWLSYQGKGIIGVDING
jgi:FlaA1/EpsC-like NDP-sugar epimerase